MPNQTIRAGVIGFGLGGKVFHAPFINAVPGLELAAIVQRKGDEAAVAYPSAKIYRTAEDLFADKSIQLIAVTTPNATHFELARAALLAGKHVVIDKPLTATSQEALELIALAKKQGVILSAFHNRRWDADFKTVKQILASGELGRLVRFESHFDRFRPLPRTGWKDSANDANGMLFDLGPHLVDQALALFGRPKSVTASVRRDRDVTQVEDAFDITLHYDGLLACMSASMLACDPSARFLLHGTLGSFRKFGLDPQEHAMVSGAKPPRVGSAEVWLAEPQSAWGTLTTATDPAFPEQHITRKIPSLNGDYRDYYAAVRDAILGNSSELVTGRDGYRMLRVLEMARESTRTGCAIKVQDADW